MSNNKQEQRPQDSKSVKLSKVDKAVLSALVNNYSIATIHQIDFIVGGQFKKNSCQKRIIRLRQNGLVEVHDVQRDAVGAPANVYKITPIGMRIILNSRDSN
jgi:hypothetical protein